MPAVVVPCPHCAKLSQLDAEKLPPRPVFFDCPHCKGRVVVDKRKLANPAADPATPPTAVAGATPPETAASVTSPGVAPPAAVADPAEARPPAVEPTVPDRRFTKVPADASFPSGIIVGEDVSVIDEVREALGTLGSEVEPVDSAEEAHQIIVDEQPQLCVYVAGPIETVPYAPLMPLTRLHPSVRRRLYLMLVADNVKTGDGLAAFLHQVNLVLGKGDLSRIGSALYSGLVYHERLYKAFVEASERKGSI